MKINSNKGASMVEFAILLPILLLLIFGIIEFGLLLFAKQVITNASREGARAGIVVSPRIPCTDIPENLSITRIVDQYCDGKLITFGTYTKPVVSCSMPSAPISGDNLTVSVTFNYEFLVLKSFGIGPVSIPANTTMRYE